MRCRYLLTGVLVVLAASCGDDSRESSEVLSPDDLPAGDVSFGVTHVMTKNGVRSAILEADTAVQQESGRQWDLRGVYIQFFTETGAESGTLTSRRGEYTPDDGSFVARDSVVLITLSPTGRRQLETEELFYDVTSEQIWSDSSFVLIDSDGTWRGSSFRSDVNGENWTAVGLESDDISTAGQETAF
jgi:LPS export ABC transporter protein LptC